MANLSMAMIAICIIAAASMATAMKIRPHEDMEITVFNMDQGPELLARHLKKLDSLYKLAGIKSDRAQLVSKLLELQSDHECEEAGFQKFLQFRQGLKENLRPYFADYIRQQRTRFYKKCVEHFSKPFYDTIYGLPKELKDRLENLVSAMIGVHWNYQGYFWEIPFGGGHSSLVYYLANHMHRKKSLVLEKWTRKEEISAEEFNKVFRENVVDVCGSFPSDLKQKAQFFLRNVAVDRQMMDATSEMIRRWVAGVYFCDQITSKPDEMAKEVYENFLDRYGF